MKKRKPIYNRSLDFRDPPQTRVAKLVQTEEASILTDWVRQYIGVAEKPSAGSGVYLLQDRILLTQAYLNLVGYDLYDEVERDPHVHAVLLARKMGVAGLDWFVDPATDSSEDQKVAEFVEEKLRLIPSFTADMIELLDGVGKGFAVSEILWAVNPKGEVIIEDIMNRPQRRFQFDATTRELKLRKMGNAFLGDPLPPQKFIVHRGSQKYEDPFGDALDQRLYWMWLFKRNVMKFWMSHNEMGAGVIPLVQHPASAGDTLKAEAMSIAQQLRNGSFGRIPSNFSVVWAEASGKGQTSDTYEKFVRFANDEISKAVLGQTLTTEGSSSTGKGSRALGQVHASVKHDVIIYDAHSLADTLNSSLIKWLVDWNFNVEQYPKFTFDTDEAIDTAAQSTMVAALVQAGFTPTREWVETTFNIELVEEEPPKAVPVSPFAPKPVPDPDTEPGAVPAPKPNDGVQNEQ